MSSKFELFLESIEDIIKPYMNFIIKNDSSSPSIKSLLSFIEQLFNKKIASLKSEKGKKESLAKMNIVIDHINDHSKEIQNHFAIIDFVVEVKMMIIKKLNKLSKYKTLLKKSEGGFEAVNDEGFVAIQGNNVVKLIDRLEFSKNNFVKTKEW
jgi:hypothetical protein